MEVCRPVIGRVLLPDCFEFRARAHELMAWAYTFKGTSTWFRHGQMYSGYGHMIQAPVYEFRAPAQQRVLEPIHPIRF